ncbi:tetraspanin-1-like isoform X2 [Babylonia areolata]|uniref:tetraspanin-1-like isoform X2 n=1 Tax=Babylonia areolata TaxID=304850 RepID=UPI003FD4C930
MCTTFIAKLVLGIINTLVFLVGLVMFIIGLLIHTQPEFSQKALSSLLEKLESTADKAGVDLDTSDFSVADVAYSFTIAIIVIGVFLAAVSLLGIIGVKYSLKPVLIVYFIITLVLFLVQVTVVLIAVIDREVFDDTVKPHLKTTIKDYYAGIAGKDATSQIWNGIMIQLECCGVDNYKDFKDASEWPTTLTINANTYNIETPVACCKDVTEDYSCAVDGTATDLNNNMSTGCYTKIWDYLLTNSGIVIGIATGVLLSQLLCEKTLPGHA